MSTRRLVDLALVLLAAVLLAAGAAYWVAAAPAPLPAPEGYDVGRPAEVDVVTQLQEAVAQRMSVVNGNVLYETVVLNADDESSWQLDLDADATYSVDVLCAGDGFAELQLPTGPLPVACQTSGYATSGTLEQQGQALIRVRQMNGEPLVVGIQVVRV